MYLVGVSILVVIWWVALWGLLEMCLKPYVKNPRDAMCIYLSMIACVFLIVWLNPDIYERIL